MKSPLLPFLLVILLAGVCRGATVQTVKYTIRIDPSDLSQLGIQMSFVQHLRGPVRIAMAAHPEYDDRYYRYIEKVTANSGARSLNVTHESDAVWVIDGVGGIVTVKYRLRFPPQESNERDAWKPFLTPTGGMVGDLHCLMYVLGSESRPATLTLDMPADWTAASGLEPTRDPRVLSGSTQLVLDAPVMVGRFSETTFSASGVPHHVVIWSPPDAKPFDAKGLVDGVQHLVRETIRGFGRPPYRRYAFLFQNGGSAALEHLSSVNIGHSLERGFDGLFEEIAHEYAHAWNLMDVRPKERVGLSYKFAAPTGVLWWNEGATIYFSDLFARRASLPVSEPSRITHLENALGRYLNGPGYSSMSAEAVSRGDTDPALLGDSFASTHLQGEILSFVLDIKIRDATGQRRDLADVQKLLSYRFDPEHGIDNSDIERAVADICKCETHSFFKEHISGAGRIDFDRYLRMIGMRAVVTRIEAVGPDGKPLVDLRIGPMAGEGPFKIRISNSQSIWGRAGLHSGDRLVSVDGKQVNGWSDLRSWLRTLKIGDRGKLEIIHDGVSKTIEVPISGYEIAKVRIVEIPEASERQRRLRSAWSNAN